MVYLTDIELEHALTMKHFEFVYASNLDGVIAYQVAIRKAPDNRSEREYFLAGVTQLADSNWGIIFDVCISDKSPDNLGNVIHYLNEALMRYRETHKYINTVSAGLLKIYWDVEHDTRGAALRGFVSGKLTTVDIITVLNFIRANITPSMVVSTGNNVYINF
jgi:hypothetical protein